MKIKRLLGLLFIVAFIIGFCPLSRAASYSVDEIGVTVDFPDTWKVVTLSDYDEDFVKQYYPTIKDENSWKSWMQRNNRYLFAAVPSDVEAQHEITVVAEQSTEPIDYDQSYVFELKFTAKTSFENNPNPDMEYRSYDVVEGKNTKYLVFDYTGKDEEGRKYYGRFYHTVIGGMSIEFDLTSYKELTSEYLGVFENTVLSAGFSKTSKDTSARLKRNLVYIALAVLAVSFIAVIVIFIVSKINEKKKFDRAAQEALRAQQGDTLPTEPAEDEDLSEDENE